MAKKEKPIEIGLAEEREIEAIIDRLNVQNPEGESFKNCLDSLKKFLSDKEHLAVAILERISQNPSPASLKAFKSIKEVVKSKKWLKLVKQIEYRLSQKGFVLEKSSKEEKVLFKAELSGEAEARLFYDKSLSRFCLMIYEQPSLRELGYIIGVELFLNNLTPEAYSEPDPTLRVVRGPKRSFKEMVSALNEVYSAPLKVPFTKTATFCKELLELYDQRWDVENIGHINVAKNLFSSYDLEDASCEIEESKDFGELISVVGPFVFSKEAMEKFRSEISSLIRPLLHIDSFTKAYNLERKIFETFKSLDTLSLGKYRIYLGIMALILASKNENLFYPSLLQKISKDIKEGNFDRWKPFIVKHMLFSIFYFAVQNLMTAKASESRLIVTPYDQGKAEWEDVQNFILEMDPDINVISSKLASRKL